MEDRFVKRLRKKAKRGMRGYPVASVAYYGPDESRASKVAVGILVSEDAEVDDLYITELDERRSRRAQRSRNRRGNSGKYGKLRRAYRRHDRPHHRLSAPTGTRLRGPVVSGLRILEGAR